jgi:hypothetical protein
MLSACAEKEADGEGEHARKKVFKMSRLNMLLFFSLAVGTKERQTRLGRTMDSMHSYERKKDGPPRQLF